MRLTPRLVDQRYNQEYVSTGLLISLIRVCIEVHASLTLWIRREDWTEDAEEFSTKITKSAARQMLMYHTDAGTMVKCTFNGKLLTLS